MSSKHPSSLIGLWVPRSDMLSADWISGLIESGTVDAVHARDTSADGEVRRTPLLSQG